MQIYYHCTYKGSPAGFNIGKLTVENQSGKIELNEEDINQFIRNCFNYGTIRKACGILPQEPEESAKYFLLVKKLVALGKTSEEPEHFSLNIAFVTDRKDQFASWMERSGDSEQQIADAIKDSMEIDHVNEFGFTVRGDKVDSLVGKSFGSLFAEYGRQDAKFETYLELSYTQTDLEELAEDLQLSEPDKVLQKVSGSEKWVHYCKKKITFCTWMVVLVNYIRNWIKAKPVLSGLLLVSIILILTVRLWGGRVKEIILSTLSFL